MADEFNLDDGGPARVTRPDDGGQAFPSGELFGGSGMSLRDWFAGQALIGLVKYYMAIDESDGEYETDFPTDFAAAAYEIADAMLKRRKET